MLLSLVVEKVVEANVATPPSRSKRRPKVPSWCDDGGVLGGGDDGGFAEGEVVVVAAAVDAMMLGILMCGCDV